MNKNKRSDGKPTDRCIYCGWSRKSIVGTQRGGVSSLMCTNSTGRHRFTDLVEDWCRIEELRTALSYGFSTTEIEADLGVKYASILVMLGRRGHEEELGAIKRLRAAEWDRRRSAA